ncbi:hypothetical protein QG37_06963 [Candidozyma auris]|nr:hypothetical protein QG37_06963 [[Candida] auris]
MPGSASEGSLQVPEAATQEWAITKWKKEGSLKTGAN